MKNIIVNKEYGYQELKPKEGYVITSFKDGVDSPENYYSSLEVDAPLSSNIDIYRTVTFEEDAVYKENKRKAEEEIEKERKLKEAENL